MSDDDQEAETSSKWSWLRLIVPIAIILVVCGAIFLWIELPGVKIVQNTPDDFEAMIDVAIARNADNFQLWYKSKIIIQCTLILTATLATVFAAVTTSKNVSAVKKWSVLLTAVTAGLASAQSTFHIRENVDTFIKANGQLHLLEMDYLDPPKPIPTEGQKAEAQGPVPREILEVQRKYMQRYVDIEATRMRAWANIGQQSVPSSDEQSKPLGDLGRSIEGGERRASPPATSKSP